MSTAAENRFSDRKNIIILKKHFFSKIEFFKIIFLQEEKNVQIFFPGYVWMHTWTVYAQNHP